MSMLKFMHLIEQLKKTPRTGWLNENIENPESIADHMYRMAIACQLSQDTSLDRDKMMKIALYHDMAESIVGDITPLDNIPKEIKSARELEAMQSICSDYLPQNAHQAKEEIMRLFLEYENKESKEARFVKDVDKYELVVQTLEYEVKFRGTKKLDHFAKSSEQIENEEVRAWCEEVLEERRAFWATVTRNEEVSSQL